MFCADDTRGAYLSDSLGGLVLRGVHNFVGVELVSNTCQSFQVCAISAAVVDGQPHSQPRCDQPVALPPHAAPGRLGHVFTGQAAVWPGYRGVQQLAAVYQHVSAHVARRLSGAPPTLGFSRHGVAKSIPGQDETAEMDFESWIGWLAFLWFWFFFILVFFILINFFLAIVMEAYENAKEEIEVQLLPLTDHDK